MDCYKARKKRKAHDREALTASIGAAIQYPSSVHPNSPNAQDELALLTSIDDFTCKILFAVFVHRDTPWGRMSARC
jgi:hypothetical protein